MGKLRLSSPCKGCESRKIYCHETCEEYKEYQDSVSLVRQRKCEYHKSQQDYIEVVTHRLRYKKGNV